MKAAAFDYVRPLDLAGAIANLEAGARPIAGGQSLVPMLNLRLARPSRLVDIRCIETLRTIEDRGTHVRIGAAVTHAELEDRAIDGCPLMRIVAGSIAYRAVRTRGTVGGSLAHADPAADWPLALAALGAIVIVEGGASTRRLPASDFMLAAFQTRLAEGELIVAIEVPKLSPTARYGYYKFCRKAGEFPEASAAAVFDSASRTARLYLGALSGAPQPLQGLAAAVARQGAAAVTEAAVADAVSQIADGDDVGRRMRRAAVARALREVFAP